MKVVFFGTPQFARDILEELLASKHEVVAVFTRPDKASKRGKELQPCVTKELALANNVDVFTPSKLSDESMLEALKSFEADVFVVAAYGCLFPKEVLEIPKFGCINVHASLLPRWRGAAPIERAILAGDTLQGVSIMKMDEGMDTGDYCASNSIDGAGESSEQLRCELAIVGANLLMQALSDIEEGSVFWHKQDPSLATYAKKIEKTDVMLDPSDSSELNYRRVLASSNSAPARCEIDGRHVRIVEAELSIAEVNAGSASWQNKELVLGCTQGSLKVKTIKPDGKKSMDAISFVAGSKNIRENIALWKSL